MDRFNFPIFLAAIIVAIFVCALILATVFLWPKNLEFQNLRKAVGAKESELQQTIDYFQKLRLAQDELKNYESEFSKIDSALPDSAFLPSLLSFVQRAGSQSGIILKEISPFAISPSDFNPKIQESQISLSLGGSYSSFKNFLSALEKSARIIEVENISFSSPETSATSSKPIPAKKSGEEKLFDFDLKIKAYNY